MITAPSIPFRRRRTGPAATRPAPRTAWDETGVLDRAVEVYAPDRLRSDLLVELATPLFRAEIVPGLVWIVRMQPPPAGTGWVLELLSLLERWLHAVKLPWVTVVYDGRSYLIRASAAGGRARARTAAKPTIELAT